MIVLALKGIKERLVSPNPDLALCNPDKNDRPHLGVTLLDLIKFVFYF